MKKQRKTKMKKTDNEKTEKTMTLDEIGRETQLRLSKHFEQWKAGLQFRFVLSSQAYRAKALGMDVGTMSSELETRGYIKVLNTPSGQRFVFAGDCDWSLEEMQNWLQEQELFKESQKEFKKQLKD